MSGLVYLYVFEGFNLVQFSADHAGFELRGNRPGESRMRTTQTISGFPRECSSLFDVAAPPAVALVKSAFLGDT